MIALSIARAIGLNLINFAKRPSQRVTDARASNLRPTNQLNAIFFIMIH